MASYRSSFGAKLFQHACTSAQTRLSGILGAQPPRCPLLACPREQHWTLAKGCQIWEVDLEKKFATQLGPELTCRMGDMPHEHKARGGSKVGSLEGGGGAATKITYPTCPSIRSETDKFGFSHCSGKTEYFKVPALATNCDALSFCLWLSRFLYAGAWRF